MKTEDAETQYFLYIIIESVFYVSCTTAVGMCTYSWLLYVCIPIVNESLLKPAGATD